MQNPQQVRQVARKIALELGERNKQPQHQIKLIVKVCGPDQAMNWLREVKSMEARGGMPTSDGTERRSPGGAFFRLVRDRLIQSGQQEQMQTIFRGKKTDLRRRGAGARGTGAPSGPRRPRNRSRYER
jgi:hypothetical protein